MRRSLLAVAALAAAWPLAGCGALVIPIAAGAAMGRNAIAGKDAGEQKPAKLSKKQRRAAAQAASAAGVTILPAGSVLPAPNGATPRGSGVAASSGPVAGVVAGAVPAGMQYLYGSGEGAAISLQVYTALRNHLSASARLRELKVEPDAVVMAPGATLAAPSFLACQGKPLAAVFDIDETVLLNLGFEADAAVRGEGYDDARWRRWEQTGAAQVRAVPGAAAAIAMARQRGISVVFNSNRLGANADATRAALRGAGLIDADPREAAIGETLWLRGEGEPSAKDMRRWQIAQKYCVIALVGDQLGDFTDLFNAPGASAAARRADAGSPQVAAMWGAGWFVLPNPVYGTALKGSLDEVFPADVRWQDRNGK